MVGALHRQAASNGSPAGEPYLLHLGARSCRSGPVPNHRITGYAARAGAISARAAC